VRRPSTAAAVAHLFLDAYGPVIRSDRLVTRAREIADDEDSEEALFISEFVVTRNDEDMVPCTTIRSVAQALFGGSVTSHAYNRWLRSKVGAENVGKRVGQMRYVVGLREREDAAEELRKLGGEPRFDVSRAELRLQLDKARAQSQNSESSPKRRKTES